jgi:hypothetical protein
LPAKVKSPPGKPSAGNPPGKKPGRGSQSDTGEDDFFKMLDL